MNKHLDTLDKIKSQLANVIVGQETMIDGLLIGLLNDGHVLLEGPPGLAKTLTISSLAQTLELGFQRVQFTPDLLPADLIGTEIYNPKTGDFSTRKGPVFSNILLADEINRAPPKVQSALLEAMQERQATIGGHSWPMPTPFLVLATQNPIEQEGTYPLPEAQSDRFLLKIKVGYPSLAEEKEVVLRSRKSPVRLQPVASWKAIQECKNEMKSLYFEESILDYILSIVRETRKSRDNFSSVNQLIANGASLRATVALEQAARSRAYLLGRGFVIPDDVKDMAHAVLRHRIVLTYEAQANGMIGDDIINTILKKVPIP